MGALRAQLEDPRGKRHLGGAGTQHATDSE